MKKSICYLFAVCAAAGLFSEFPLLAQTHLFSPEHRCVQSDVDPRASLLKKANSWSASANPASIGVQPLPDLGSVQFAGDHYSGGLHRAMDSDVMNSWGFGADSYKSLKNLNLWGDFSFMSRRHLGRNWSDNLEPYNGNPYQAGSSIKGDYAEQTFDFGVKVASKRLFDRMWFGLGLDYAIGDFSRLNDPRSRVQFADMALVPGVVIQLAEGHKLGMELTYRYRKEKNNKYVSKSAGGNEFHLTRQEGLGMFSTILSSNFERRVKGSYLGGGLQYEYGKAGFSLMSSLDYCWRSDAIEDRMKESPGDYTDHAVDLGVTARWWAADFVRRLGLDVTGSYGMADRFFQELYTETDPQTNLPLSYYRTLSSVQAFTHLVLSADLSYDFFRLRGGDVLWFAGAGMDFWSLADRYVFYVPDSELGVSSLALRANGGLRVWSRGRHRLFADLGLAYHLNLSGNLFMSPDLDHHVVWDGVTAVDFSVWSSDVLEMGLGVKYLFPVSKRYDGFVSVRGMDLLSTSLDSRNRLMAGLAVGISQRF